MSIERMQSGPRMSQAVTFNKTVYLAGQVAEDGIGPDIGLQTASVLKSIDALLASASSDKSRLLSVTIYLTDMDLFAGMNRIWDAWIDPRATPARATVVSTQLAGSEYLIEISVVAAQR
jgi:enamine deaminase RidA (YjgF/YER057c/UK114 family)